LFGLARLFMMLPSLVKHVPDDFKHHLSSGTNSKIKTEASLSTVRSLDSSIASSIDGGLLAVAKLLTPLPTRPAFVKPGSGTDDEGDDEHLFCHGGPPKKETTSKHSTLFLLKIKQPPTVLA
jgi:hypothetical protein